MFGGNILFRFTRLGQVLEWIYNEIYRISPVRTGAYRADNQLWINGVRVAPGSRPNVPPGAECWLVNTEPYARRIEHGWSIQAPNGVYEITAIAAKLQFPTVDITFVYTQRGDVAPVIHSSRRRDRVHNSYAYPTIIVRSPP